MQTLFDLCGFYISHVLLAILAVLGAGFVAFINSPKQLNTFAIFLFLAIVAIIGLNFSATLPHLPISNLSDTGFVSLIIQTIILSFTAISLIFAINETSIFHKKPELIIILLFSAVGGLFLTNAKTFLMIYLGLELQAIPIYIAVIFARNAASENLSSESGLKYFVLGAVASCMMIYSISLIYGFTGGQIGFDLISQSLMQYADNLNSIPTGLKIGFWMFIFSIFFKISVFPFHFWTMDLYTASNISSISFISAIPKIVGLWIIYQVAQIFSLYITQDFIFQICAGASMLIGACGALRQTNLKRIVAYSSVLNFGFALLCFMTAVESKIPLFINYFTIYTISTLSFLFVLCLMEERGIIKADNFELAGFYKSHPYIAFFLSIILFSLAGIPPLAGFFAKFYVIKSLVLSEYYITAVLAVFCSVIASFYYLNIVKIIYFDKPSANTHQVCISIFGQFKVLNVIVLLFFFVFALFFILKPDFMITL